MDIFGLVIYWEALCREAFPECLTLSFRKENNPIMRFHVLELVVGCLFQCTFFLRLK